jgi:acetyl-CoA acetyltransferase
MALNRLCSSGLQAVVSSAQGIMLGDHQLAIGGGVENMSRGGYLSPAMRAGARMGDSAMIDMMVSTLTDPFGVGHMGITAETLATKWHLSREAQDAYAAESHARAAKAVEAGHFKSQIVPIELKSRRGSTFFETDEHIKAGTTAEFLAGMRPEFNDMDVIESNEAFAAQALTVAKGLDLDPLKTNPNGGAIALGHPIGASGAVIATKAIHELHRLGGKYALVTMCIGGGQGIAVIFERL